MPLFRNHSRSEAHNARPVDICTGRLLCPKYGELARGKQAGREISYPSFVAIGMGIDRRSANRQHGQCNVSEDAIADISSANTFQTIYRYIVDGNAMMLSATDIVRRRRMRKPQETSTIIIGISYPLTRSVYSPRRNHDLTPPCENYDSPKTPDGKPNPQEYGGADAFLNFITTLYTFLYFRRYFLAYQSVSLLCLDTLLGPYSPSMHSIQPPQALMLILLQVRQFGGTMGCCCRKKSNSTTCQNRTTSLEFGWPMDHLSSLPYVRETSLWRNMKNGWQ
jgi:Predicted hydrolase of the alpha/beta superfamily